MARGNSLAVFMAAASWAFAQGPGSSDWNAEGTRLADQGRYAEAEAAFRKSLALCEQSNCADVVALLSNTGMTLLRQDRLDEAAAMYRRALDVAGSGARSGDLAPVLNNLAGVRVAQGKFKEAEGLYRDAIQRWESQYGKDHPHVAAGLNSLAVLLQSRGRLHEAERLLTRARAIEERRFPPDHVRIAFGYNNQAALEVKRKRYWEAEALVKKALAILEQRLPGDHPELGKTWSNLANIYGGLKRWEDAADAYQRALRVLTAAWGSNDRRLLPVLDLYAIVLRHREEFADAERLSMQAMRIRVMNTLRPEAR
jgi:tetratricopeptide (TPR) repeat protein